LQAVSSTLQRHIEGAPSNARKLQPMIAPLMEEVAALIEDGIPAALAPFEARAGPVTDAEDLERALQEMYASCTAACRGAGAASRRSATPQG
jgi:hypothetical protein